MLVTFVAEPKTQHQEAEETVRQGLTRLGGHARAPHYSAVHALKHVHITCATQSGADRQEVDWTGKEIAVSISKVLEMMDLRQLK